MDRYDPEVVCRRQESGMETGYEAFVCLWRQMGLVAVGKWKLRDGINSGRVFKGFQLLREHG